MVTPRIQNIFNQQHANRRAVGASNAKERIAKLKRLQKYLLEHVDEACRATEADFQKPEAETIIGELLVLQSELSYAIKNLERWMALQKQATPLTALGTTSYIQYEAKGCALIIAPWNYPINLALKPLISAVAAGCVAIIKPSELTPNSSAFVKTVIEYTFSPDEVAVIEGDAEVSTQLLLLPFNHIFFTGSPAIGKVVMRAAAEHLASVTLELGGKSPSIIDETADIRATARRITWGKFFNNGQTCIAPDYVLVQDSVREKFVNEMKLSIMEMFDSEKNGIEGSTAYGRIVNDKHFQRLTGYLKDASDQGAVTEFGGSSIAEQRYISPTILTKVNGGMQLMKEEIFGPILPVKSFGELSEAVAYINANEKPLALYIHSSSNKNADYILKNTSAGNALVNELLTQFGNPEIPFGGVNNSGIGKSNGFYGFQEFSNAKGVMKRKFGTISFLYPPYSAKFMKILRSGLKYI
jgi:aldehyde dehydrogenase (NAD+)